MTEGVIIEARTPVLVVKYFGARLGVLQVLMDRRFRQGGKSAIQLMSYSSMSYSTVRKSRNGRVLVAGADDGHAWPGVNRRHSPARVGTEQICEHQIEQHQPPLRADRPPLVEMTKERQTVRVVEEEAVGIYEVAVLEAGSAKPSTSG